MPTSGMTPDLRENYDNPTESRASLQGGEEATV